MADYGGMGPAHSYDSICLQRRRGRCERHLLLLLLLLVEARRRLAALLPVGHVN